MAARAFAIGAEAPETRVMNLHDCMEYAISNSTKVRIQQAEIGDAQIALQPPMTGGRRLKIYYGTQTDVCPPTFSLFVNDGDLMHFAYQRYLENQLRKAFDFSGTPIRFTLREKTKENA